MKLEPEWLIITNQGFLGIGAQRREEEFKTILFRVSQAFKGKKMKVSG